MSLLVIILLFFFGLSCALLMGTLAFWRAIKRRRTGEGETVPVNKRAFLTAAIPGAFLALVALPAELLFLQSVFHFKIKGGSVIFVSLFIASFLSAVHAFAWGYLNSSATNNTRKKMALTSALVLGAIPGFTIAISMLAFIIRFAVRFWWAAVFIVLPGYLILSPKGRRIGFPAPTSHARMRAFLFPFFIGADVGLVFGVGAVAVLLTASGYTGGEVGSAVGVAFLFFLSASIIALLNGIWWGVLNARTRLTKNVGWKAYAKPLFIIVGAILILSLALFSARQLGPYLPEHSALWLIGAVLTALISLGLWYVFKPGTPTKTQDAASAGGEEHPQVRGARISALQPESLQGQRRAFVATLLLVSLLVGAMSAGFGIGAWLALKHWAENPGGGGWINLSGIVEMVIVMGLQLVASVICFFGSLGLASRLSLPSQGNLWLGISQEIIFGLLGAVTNFLIDVMLFVTLMRHLGLP